MRFGLDIWNPEKWQTGRDLVSLQREMDRLFDRFSSHFPTLPTNKGFDFVPACDVEETDTQYVFKMDAPGMKKEDLKVELVDNVLTISGEHKEEKREGKKKRITERYQGRFERSFSLPNSSDSTKIEANFADGVLHIAVHKAAAAKAKQIPIGEGKPVQKVTGKEPIKSSAETSKSVAA